jgi:hypothetical protein
LQTSPTLELEPALVDYVERLSEIGMPLNREGVSKLVISIISGQPIEEKVIPWKKAHCSYYKSMPLLGISWYHHFIQCNSDKLTRKKALIQEVQHETWVKYENFQNMYVCVYNQMVIAGVTRKLPKKAYCDRDGAIFDEEKAFGFAPEYELLYPEMVVTVDETGANTNQKHGHLGGELFVVGPYQLEFGQLGAATNKHFTVLVFNVATGKHIMVAVILKSE